MFLHFLSGQPKPPLSGIFAAKSAAPHCPALSCSVLEMAEMAEMTAVNQLTSWKKKICKSLSTFISLIFFDWLQVLVILVLLRSIYPWLTSQVPRSAVDFPMKHGLWPEDCVKSLGKHLVLEKEDLFSCHLLYLNLATNFFSFNLLYLNLATENGKMAALRGNVSQWDVRMWMELSEWFQSFRITSGKLTVCYWKWPVIVDFPVKNGDFP